MEPLKPLFDTFDDLPRWWPEGLGAHPSAAGTANDHRYAYFAATERLAIEDGGSTAVYDTTGCDIQGVSQATASGTKLIIHDASGKAHSLDDFKRLN